MTEATLEPYVPLEEVARYFAVSPSTVRIWTRSNKVPHIRAGGVFRYKLSEVDKALREADKKPEVEKQPEVDPRQMSFNFDPDSDV